MTTVKQAACSKAAVRRHQTTCHPDEFWTMVWCMWWRQRSGDSNWPQAPTCMHLRDTTVERLAKTGTCVVISQWCILTRVWLWSFPCHWWHFVQA